MGRYKASLFDNCDRRLQPAYKMYKLNTTYAFVSCVSNPLGYNYLKKFISKGKYVIPTYKKFFKGGIYHGKDLHSINNHFFSEQCLHSCPKELPTLNRFPLKQSTREIILITGVMTLSFSGAEMVIRDWKTWAWFWKKHTRGIQPEPPLPKVDFRTKMVVAAILGYKTSGGGPSIEISSIEAIFGNYILPIKSIRVFVKENRTPGPL